MNSVFLFCLEFTFCVCSVLAIILPLHSDFVESLLLMNCITFTLNHTILLTISKFVSNCYSSNPHLTSYRFTCYLINHFLIVSIWQGQRSLAYLLDQQR